MNASGFTPTPFSEWLQRRITRRGWSAADLARESDIRPQTISKWLLGETTPNKTELIKKLAQTLDVHIDEILEVLDVREGGADHMSHAVRSLAPIVDRYEWSELELERLAEIIESIAMIRLSASSQNSLE